MRSMGRVAVPASGRNVVTAGFANHRYEAGASSSLARRIWSRGPRKSMAIMRMSAAELSIVLGEPSSWGQGLGTEAMELLLSFAFGPLGLRRVWLIVRADNQRALRLFRRMGFVVVETQVGVVVVDGQPRDKLRMELTR